jgi:CRISPR-associated protein Cmr1
LDSLGQPETFNKGISQRINGRDQPTGRDYLFWSMARMGRDGFNRQYYPPGRTFTLTLSQRVPDQKALEKAVAAFWLLTYLGGIGARSRRAAGSLAVTQVSSPFSLPLSFQTPETAEKFSAFLRKGLDDARKIIAPTPAAGASASPPQFDVLAPLQNACRIWVLHHLPLWSTSQQALETIGASMRDFRSRRPPDHDEVARWLTGQGTPPTIQRAAFGLPIQFRYSNGGPSGFVQSTNHDHDRRASPVLLRVAKLSGTSPQYVGVVVLFKAQFLPPGERLEAKNNRSARPLSPPADYSLIEQWINTFPHRLGVW